MAKKSKRPRRRKPGTGQFVNVIRPQTRSHIRKLAQDLNLPLTGIARMKDVTIETVIRLAKGRLSRRETQRLYFNALKGDVLSVVQDIQRARAVVTVLGVRTAIKTYSGVNVSKSLVSRALRVLEAEGHKIDRPEEYHTARKRTAARLKVLKATDKKIVKLRGKYPQMRDSELAEKVGITYDALRKRITALKKAGRLPNVRRGYKAK